jgi:DNA-binding transcriptional regulator YiaG
MTAEEFSKVADSTGLKPGKLAELLGKTSQTVRLYRSGARNVPKLVAEKIITLDKAINGGE